MMVSIMKPIRTIQAIQRKKWLPHPLTLLSGILIVLAFPPWDLGFLTWICLVPWFFAIQKADSPARSFVEGFWLNFLMTLGCYFWIAYSLKEFGGVPWPVGFLGLFLFCLVGQPQFMVLPPILKAMRLTTFLPEDAPEDAQNKKSHATHAIHATHTHATHTKGSRLKKLSFWHGWQGILSLLWLSLLYTGIDWIAPKMFLDTLGHALYQASYLRQIADLGGAQLLTFLIVLTNISLYGIVKNFLKERRVKLSPQLLFTAALLLSAFAYGWVRQAQVLKIIETTGSGIQIAAIQGNIGDFDKIAAENDVSTAALKVIDTFISMTDRALNLSPPPEVVIWPETSFPSLFRQPFTQLEILINDRVETYVRDHGVPLLFGGYDRQFGKEFNAFFFLQPDGQLQTYHKNKLLLFGEYIPGADSIQFFKDTFPQVGNFGKGPGPQVLELGTQNGSKITRVAPIICYEALFTNFLIESARDKSQLIINITNDSWFGPWGEPHLHLALTTFRSIETRLPMLRSTNTGISTLITADGEITHATGIGTQEIMNVNVPITPPIWSLIKAWGDWFGPFALITGLLGLAILSRMLGMARFEKLLVSKRRSHGKLISKVD